MSKDSSKKLSELKSLLPSDYRKQILEEAENVSLNDVKRAFAGTLDNENKLIAILVAANKIIRRQAKKKEKVSKLLEQTVSVAKN